MTSPHAVRPAPATTGNRPRIDRLGGAIDPPNNATTATMQTLLRAGNAATCATCGEPLNPKRASRRQRYCCYGCRDEARRQRNFAVSGGTRYPSQVIPRSVQNNNARSTACNGLFRGRAARLSGPAHVVEAELLGGRAWSPMTSPDGEIREVARLREVSRP